MMALAGSVIGCHPTTTRPSFLPIPEAARVEIQLSPREATTRLAETLRADSIPAGTVHVRDGWLETRWFDAGSGALTHRRPIGPDVVRVRGWSDPGRPGYAVLTVETVYRPLADPSLPPRELEREVPRDNPTSARVRAALKALADRYGTPPAEAPRQPSPVEPGAAEPSVEPPAGEIPPNEVPPTDEGSDQLDPGE